MIADIVRLGFGSSVNLIPTLGYSQGAAAARLGPTMFGSTAQLKSNRPDPFASTATLARSADDRPDPRASTALPA